jgi:hypothetical protein
MGAVGGQAASVATAKVVEQSMTKGMMSEGMSGMMKSSMAQAGPAAASVSRMAKGATATGAVVTAGSSAGRSFVRKILKHPLVLLGLGIAVGYTVHKYRREIIDAANRVAERGKDFVLQQRESLEDIVAESREQEE